MAKVKFIRANKSLQAPGHLVQQLLIGTAVQQGITALGLKERIIRVLHGMRIGLQEVPSIKHFAELKFHPHGDALTGKHAAPFDGVAAAAGPVENHFVRCGQGQRITIFAKTTVAVDWISATEWP